MKDLQIRFITIVDKVFITVSFVIYLLLLTFSFKNVYGSPGDVFPIDVISIIWTVIYCELINYVGSSIDKILTELNSEVEDSENIKEAKKLSNFIIKYDFTTGNSIFFVLSSMVTVLSVINIAVNGLYGLFAVIFIALSIFGFTLKSAFLFVSYIKRRQTIMQSQNLKTKIKLMGV